MYVSGDKKCSFFGKFGVLCFPVTPALRFTLLPYCRALTGSIRFSKYLCLKFKVKHFWRNLTFNLWFPKYWKWEIISYHKVEYYVTDIHWLHKKWRFPFRISSVNVTKFAAFYGFGHIDWRTPQWKTSFFVQWCLLRRFEEFI